jgi:glycosyltransferase involved in cell wall biosynthesis
MAHPEVKSGAGNIRLAALYSHPIQYFAPLFRELADRTDVDLTVYYCSRQGLDTSFDQGFGKAFQWDIPLLEGYRSKFLSNWRMQDNGITGFFQHVNPGIISEIARNRYDAILIHGYEHLTKWLAFFMARLTGTRILLRGESHLLGQRAWYVRVAKAMALFPLMRLISAGLYIGRNNYDFYQHYGMPQSRLFFAPYVVDNVFFQTQAHYLKPRRSELRAALGVLDERPIILACGKLIEKKQPLLLLRAFQQVRHDLECTLVFAGDGVLRSQIEQTVQEDRIPDVVVTGFINQSKISEVYAMADVLALVSSYEPWGLVVNEAMNFGLPIVVSERVGCARDLVHPGENGFTFESCDVNALASHLRTLMSDVECRRRMGQRSLEIIADYSLARTAQAIVKAAR